MIAFNICIFVYITLNCYTVILLAYSSVFAANENSFNPCFSSKDDCLVAYGKYNYYFDRSSSSYFSGIPRLTPFVRSKFSFLFFLAENQVRELP